MSLRFRYDPWRALYAELLAYGGDAWTEDILLPWSEANRRSVADLRRIGRAEAMNVAVPNDHDNYTPLQALYVLNRVLDVLIAPAVPGVPEPAARRSPWEGGIPGEGVYDAFCRALGCVQVSEEDRKSVV